MAGLWGNQGEAVLLDMITNGGVNAQADLVLKLFKNNYTIVDGTTEGALTVADFPGYGSKTISGASWTTTPGAPSVATCDTQTFTATADTTLQYIYGYALFLGTKYLCGENPTDAPYAIVNSGDYVEIKPTLQMKKAGE